MVIEKINNGGFCIVLLNSYKAFQRLDWGKEFDKVPTKEFHKISFSGNIKPETYNDERGNEKQTM